jgi:hypothetical protein
LTLEAAQVNSPVGRRPYSPPEVNIMSRSVTPRRHAAWLAIALLLLGSSALTVGRPAAAASARALGTTAASIRVGVYKVSGDITFKIYLVASECPDYATGIVKRGTCLAAYPDPRVSMDCPTGAGFQPDFIAPLPLPYNVYLPKSGRLTVTTVTSDANGLKAGHTTFSIVVKSNGTASGSVVREQFTTWGTRTTCTTGPLKFTAKHK